MPKPGIESSLRLGSGYEAFPKYRNVLKEVFASKKYITPTAGARAGAGAGGGKSGDSFLDLPPQLTVFRLLTDGSMCDVSIKVDTPVAASFISTEDSDGEEGWDNHDDVSSSDDDDDDSDRNRKGKGGKKKTEGNAAAIVGAGVVGAGRAKGEDGVKKKTAVTPATTGDFMGGIDAGVGGLFSWVVSGVETAATNTAAAVTLTSSSSSSSSTVTTTAPSSSLPSRSRADESWVQQKERLEARIRQLEAENARLLSRLSNK